jgi:hypothetical protein
MLKRNRTLVLLGAFLLWGCSDGTGLGNEAGVSLSFSTGSAGGAAAASAASFAVTAGDLTDGQGNTLTIDSAHIVLREIELKSVEVVNCDVEPEPEGCEEFETGPILVALDPNGGTKQEVTISVPPGSYDEIEFEIHKVSSDGPEDAAFRTAHSDMVNKSIRVWASYNGGPQVTYVTDLDVEQEFDLASPLVVVDGTSSTNVTVRIDLSKWFVDGSGNLVDPDTGNKGGDNESLVKENIKQSIEAFEDKDRDGDDTDES